MEETVIAESNVTEILLTKRCGGADARNT